MGNGNRTGNAIGAWEITRTFDKDGKNWNVWSNNEDSTEIVLPQGQRPTKPTLDLLAANGMEPQTVTIRNDTVPGDVTQNDEPEETEQSPLDRILAQVKNTTDPDDRAEIRVWNVDDPKLPMWCDKFTPQEWEENDLSILRKHFGSGTYRVEVWATMPRTDANGNAIKYGGKFVKRGSQVLKINAPIVPRGENAASDPMGALAPFMRELMQRQDAMLRAIMDRKSADPFADFERLIRMQALLQPRGNGGNGRGIGSVMDDLEALETLRARLKGESNTDGKDNEPNSLLGMGKQLLDVLPDLMAARGQRNPGGENVAPVLSLPQSVAGNGNANETAPENQTQENEVNSFQQIALNATISSLVRAAEKGEAVDEHAKGLLGMMPDEMVGILGMPTWFDILSEMQPEVAKKIEPQKEWFGKLRAKMLELLDEEGMDE